MRPNQQNNKNRSRGRNNGGRKHGNPLSRNYESNGPDVKVRGNASHVAEKYQQLARDALTSGDSVMAENYLQHAEHYYRIVMAAQSSQTVRPDPGQDNDSDDTEEADGNVGQRQQNQPERVNGSARQDREPANSRPKRQDDAEETVTAAVEPAARESQPAEDVSAAETQEAEAPRKRRPRRRRTTEAEAAPQAEGGELPAFITSSTAAAE